jgi:alkyl hydroperoxide reductase subunit AhpC
VLNCVFCVDRVVGFYSDDLAEITSETVFRPSMFRGSSNVAAVANAGARRFFSGSLARSTAAGVQSTASRLSMSTPQVRSMSTEPDWEDEDVEELAEVGHDAPDFEMPAVVDGEFQNIQLSDYRGEWVVLFFYPLDFTFVCPTEINEFSDMSPEFAKENCKVLGVSVDSKFTHLQWTKTPRNQGGIDNIKIPLLSDLDHEVSSSYGVLMEEGHTLRATFIVDPDGVLRWMNKSDPSVGRNVPEVLRIVKALQYADENGEVCPAGWTEGGDTITPDVNKAGDYFSKH